MLHIRTDPAILARLSEAAERGPTPKERYLQKISFISSSLSRRAIKVTPEQVEQELRRMAGNIDVPPR